MPDTPHESLLVDGANFRHIGPNEQLAAIYRSQLFIKSQLEKIMADAKREAGETADSFVVVKAGITSAFDRLTQMLVAKDATIAERDAKIAELQGIAVEDAEAAAISDQTQKDMQVVADDLGKIGVPVEVPPPVETPPSEPGVSAVRRSPKRR